MRYLRLFESFDVNSYRIHGICKQYGIGGYTINNDGSIDASFVSFRSEGITEIPLKFNKINGIFSCSCNKLTSLEGSPVEINGHFYCRDNKLTSFQYAPKIIRGDFDCNYNNIKSFEYFPNHVGGDFDCEVNPIEEVWRLFYDTTKIELLNDFDMFRDEDTDTPAIVMDRLNDFLLTIGKKEVENVYGYKNI